ncbi:MAG: hypothetical protein ACLPKB_24490 [Xanthobacteraceae bacterium]
MLYKAGRDVLTREPMTPDPRWLESLKASGWQTAAVAIACAFFLWANRTGSLPPLEPWMIQLAAIVMFTCGFLALASVTNGAIEKIGTWCTTVKLSIALRHSIGTLNAEETTCLKAQIEKSGQHFTYRRIALAAYLSLFGKRLCTEGCKTRVLSKYRTTTRRVKSKPYISRRVHGACWLTSQKRLGGAKLCTGSKK